MWEIFAVGKSPYKDVHPLVVMRDLKDGMRMEIPQNGACNDIM